MFKKLTAFYFLFSLLFFAAHAMAEIAPVGEDSTHPPSANVQAEAIHQELRSLLQGLEKAINEKRYADLKQYFTPNLHVTTINQNVITTPDGIDAYFNEWFGEGGYLKSLNIKLNADALTQLYGDPYNPGWGMVYGSGVEDYQLTDGRFLSMRTRWTATVSKGDDGHWRILALHIGANFYDNPIYNAVAESRRYYALGGLTLGLLAGFFVARLLRRKSA